LQFFRILFFFFTQTLTVESEMVALASLSNFQIHV